MYIHHMKCSLLFLFSIALNLPLGYAAADSTISVRTTTIVVVGDSLAEGLGVASEESFPSVLEALLGKDVKVVNGGVSGATSASALQRIKWFEKSKPAIIILELGGNDMLRGLSPAKTMDNLAKAIDYAKSKGMTVLLAGMRAAPNMGKSYTAAFDRIFPDLARKKGVALIPFILEVVAGEPSMNQPDGIHPNAAGQRKIAEILAQPLRVLMRAETPR